MHSSKKTSKEHPAYSQYRGRDRDHNADQIRGRRRVMAVDSLNTQKELLYYGKQNPKGQYPRVKGDDVLDMTVKTIQEGKDNNYKASVRAICNHLVRYSLPQMARSLIMKHLVEPRVESGKEPEDELYKLIRQIFVEPVDFVLNFGETSIKNAVGEVQNVHCMSFVQFFGDKSHQYSVAEIFSPEIQNILKIMCRSEPTSEDIFKYTKAYNSGSATYVKKDFLYNKTFSDLFPREELALSIFTQLVRILEVYFDDKLCGMECVRNVVDKISKDAVDHMQQGVSRNNMVLKCSREFSLINQFVSNAYKFFAWEFSNIEYLKTHTFSFVSPCYSCNLECSTDGKDQTGKVCIKGTTITPESIKSITPPQRLY